jgi:Mitochondrial carrier protein
VPRVTTAASSFLGAGCGNVLLTNPIWVVATRMQAHKRTVPTDEAGNPTEAHQKPTTVAVIREIYTDFGALVRPVITETNRTPLVLLARRIGHSVPVWQPLVGSALQ